MSGRRRSPRPVCDTPGCGRTIPIGGEGHPEICPVCIAALNLHDVPRPVVPVPMILHCPKCGGRHIDEGEFATKPHHTHACQECGVVWRPAIVHTVGVRFLPGFKNIAATLPSSQETKP